MIGLFVGIDMVFSGWSWVMPAIGVRSAFAGRALSAGPEKELRPALSEASGAEDYC